MSETGEEGVGLRNTRERLAVLYGAAGGVSLVQTQYEAVASVWLPFRSDAVRMQDGIDVSDVVGV